MTNEAGADAATAGSALVTGNAYLFKLRAVNEEGGIYSTNYETFTIASVPSTPSAAPT